MAAEGEDYSVVDEDEPADFAADSANAAEELAEGEPDDGIDGDEPDTDADAARAAVMRKARVQARRAAAASASRGLPMIPGSATPASASTSGKRVRRRELSTFAQWRLCCRVCMRWRVLKHILAMLFLPTLCTLGAIYYFYFMPAAGVSFAAALVRGDAVTVRHYIDWQGATVDGPLPGDEQDRSPIHLAALGNHTELVRLLVDRGASLGARDVQGLTPLHYAAHVGSFAMVELLLQRGADVEARDDNLRTPLHLAAIVGSVPVLALLIFNGQADLRTPDADNYLAGDYARLFHTSNLQKLVEDGYYYHPGDGRMRVIAQAEFQAVRERVAEPWDAQQPQKQKQKQKQMQGGGSGSSSSSSSTASARKQEKSQSKARKQAAAKAAAEAKAKANEERKQRKRQRRAKARGSESGSGSGSAPAPDSATVAAPAKTKAAEGKPSTPLSASEDDEDAELMALFTGEADAHIADLERFRRSAEELARQQQAKDEYAQLQQSGSVDQDEFEL